MECNCLEYVAIAAIVVITYKLVDWIVRIPRISSLDSRYILVTGCDTGFGRDFTERLDRLGCHVFAGCLSERGQQDVKKLCSDRVVPLPLDVASEQSVRKAYEFVRERLPEGKGLWGVCNNAGIGGNGGPVEWLTLEDYRQVLRINLLGVVDVSTVFLPLVKRARGRIVNTASVMGRITFTSMAPYCMSKYGVESFSDSLRRQLRAFGVSVHLIEPGWFRTNITDITNIKANIKAMFQRCTPEVQREYGEQYVEQACNLADSQIEKMRSAKTYLVVDAYVHAMLGRFPRARYVVGADANYMLLPIQSLPTCLGDAALEMFAKKKLVPQACK